MAKKTGFSAAQVAEGFKLIAGGKDELLEHPQALADVTEQVLLLANASGVDLATASTTVVQALNQFGKGAEHAGKFVDILAAGAKFGASEVDDTSQALLVAGPNARAAGLDFANTAAALQAIAKGGLKGSRAGTGFAGVLLNLREQGHDFANLGLSGVLEKIKGRLDRIKNPTFRAAQEIKLFGKEHTKTGLALLDNIGFLKEMDVKIRTTGIASQQAAIRLDTFSKKSGNDESWYRRKDYCSILNRLEDQKVFTNMANDLGVFLETINSDDIEQMVSTVKDLASAALAVAKAFRTIFILIKGIGIGIGEFAGQIATFDFSKLSLQLHSKMLSKLDALKNMWFGDDKKIVQIKNEELITSPPVAPVAPASEITKGDHQVKSEARY